MQDKLANQIMVACNIASVAQGLLFANPQLRQGSRHGTCHCRADWSAAAADRQGGARRVQGALRPGPRALGPQRLLALSGEAERACTSWQQGRYAARLKRPAGLGQRRNLRSSLTPTGIGHSRLKSLISFDGRNWERRAPYCPPAFRTLSQFAQSHKLAVDLQLDPLTVDQKPLSAVANQCADHGPVLLQRCLSFTRGLGDSRKPT
jgi:hypothetical protein